MTDARTPSASPRSPVPPASTPGESEDARLAEFGYEQRLDRSVGTLASFAIGFATISATTAVFTGFGAGYFTAGGPFVWTLLLAGAGFWWALFDRERLAWHDRASGTRMVRGPRS